MKIIKTVRLPRYLRGFATALWLSLMLAAMAPVAMARQTITMGLNVGWPADSFYALAVAKHLVPPGYDVKVQILQDPLTAYSLLAAGKLDILGGTSDYVPVAVAKSLPIAAVAMNDLSYGTDQIVAGPGVRGASDLKGKKVAAPQAYIGELLMGLYLNKIGLSPKDVQWVDLNAPDAVGSMLSGELGAAYMYNPWVSKVLKNMKGAHVVATSGQSYYLKTGILGDTIYMNRDFVRDHRKAALAMLKLRYRALQYWHDHTKESNAFIAKFLKWPVADVESVVGTNGKFEKGGVYLFDFEQAARYCGVMQGGLPLGLKNGQWPAAAHLTNQWWIKLGLLKQMHDVTRGIDCSLLGDLAKTGFHQKMSARQ